MWQTINTAGARVLVTPDDVPDVSDLRPWHGNPGLVWLHKRTVPVAQAAWNAYQARDWDLSADLLAVADYLEAAAGEHPESATRRSIAATITKVRSDQARGCNAPTGE